MHPEAPTLRKGQQGLWAIIPGEPRGTNSWYRTGGPTDHLSWCTQRHQLMVQGRREYRPPLLVHPEAPTHGMGQEDIRTTSPGAPRYTNSWYGTGGQTDHLTWCTQRHQLLVRGRRAYGPPLLVHPDAPNLGRGQEGLWTTSPGAPRGTNSCYGVVGDSHCTSRGV